MLDRKSSRRDDWGDAVRAFVAAQAAWRRRGIARRAAITPEPTVPPEIPPHPTPPEVPPVIDPPEPAAPAPVYDPPRSPPASFRRWRGRR
jgi:hypothetical protein